MPRSALRKSFRSAGRTGEAATALEGHVEMDAVVSRFEAHIDDFPRRLQAQCGSEQGGLLHEASPVGSRAGLRDEQVGGWTDCASFGCLGGGGYP